MSNSNGDRIEEAFALGTPIDEAVEAAARQAFEEHLRWGRTMPVWRNGEVVWLPPEEVCPEWAAEMKASWRPTT